MERVAEMLPLIENDDKSNYDQNQQQSSSECEYELEKEFLSFVTIVNSTKVIYIQISFLVYFVILLFIHLIKLTWIQRRIGLLTLFPHLLSSNYKNIQNILG